MKEASRVLTYFLKLLLLFFFLVGIKLFNRNLSSIWDRYVLRGFVFIAIFNSSPSYDASINFYLYLLHSIYIFVGSLMVLFLYIFCYFGEMVTDRSLVVGNAAYSSLWYKYPLELQRFLQLTIFESHIQFHFSGLGIMYVFFSFKYVYSVFVLNFSKCFRRYCTMQSFSGVSSILLS